MNTGGKYHTIAVLFVLILFLCAANAQSVKSVDELRSAFAKDGYDVVKVVQYNGKKGIRAEHKTACHYETKKKKKAFYVEGNAYEMGYLIGNLAEEDVEIMSTVFLDNIIFDFINTGVTPEEIPIIWGILKSIIIETNKSILPDVPKSYIQEIEGLVAGCKAVNPKTKVCFDDLFAINVGIDSLLATMYTGKFQRDHNIDMKKLKVPVMCNAFSVFGKATKTGEHYLGRDFMFPTGKSFDRTGCLIIYNPNDGRLPLVSMTAPGFVGSIAAMNKDGIGMGVDMSPAGNCNPSRPGINSLLMVRNTTHVGTSAKKALQTILNTPRGVSWLYFVADGKNDKAFVAEAGYSTDDVDPLQYVPFDLKLSDLVPDEDFLEEHETQKYNKGLVVRWNDYKYPEKFLEFNKGLFEYHEKKFTAAMWGKQGYVNKVFGQEGCPSAAYFAPQREDKDDVLLISNHTIVPTARLCGMDAWTDIIASHKFDDIQWRYDELNNQILSAYGKIDEAKAIEIIDFLAPYRSFPAYYEDSPKSTDGKTSLMKGSVSLFNLTTKVVHNHYGYYADEWVTISLLNYVD